jgi:DNA-binding NarL/FixJ family response regulator
VRARSYLAWIAAAYGPLAEALARAGSADAQAVLAEAEALVDKHEQHYARPYLLRARGLILWQHGKWRSAHAALRASADVARMQKAGVQLARTLATIAQTAHASGDHHQATQARVELADVVERIGPEVRGLPWAGGQRSPNAAATARRAHTRERASPLTRREQEVAVLVGQGLSNREIAQALVIAEGTVGVHIGHIFSKLGFRSRTQLALWTVEQDLRAKPTT